MWRRWLALAIGAVRSGDSIGMVQRLNSSVASIFAWCFSTQQQRRVERLIVKISLLSFILHLLLVQLARSLPHPGVVLSAVGTNYLAAIYTPFSFILFYEALMLIAAIPRSTTGSIAKQFKIVSLVFIRKFFKDIAHLADVGKLESLSPEMKHVLLDVAAGLSMFLLVTLFLRATQTRLPRHEEAPDHSAELRTFIRQKKAIALGLLVTFLVLVVSNLSSYVAQVYSYLYQGGAQPDPNAFFYTDLFVVMIFTDVLLVILSIAVSDSYELVFRNEAFVISTILLRISLTVQPPWSVPVALAGMAVGIAAVLIYNYNVGMMPSGGHQQHG